MDFNVCSHNWSAEMKNIMSEINMNVNFDDQSCINLELASKELSMINFNKWKGDLNSSPKLRTYKLFKNSFSPEPYVYLFNRRQRSLIAQIRAGILPLHIETGRFMCIPVELRLCMFCDDNVCETEIHFLFECLLYSEIRQNFYREIAAVFPDFVNLDNEEKIKYIWGEHVIKFTAIFCEEAMSKRRRCLYS